MFTVIIKKKKKLSTLSHNMQLPHNATFKSGPLKWCLFHLKS